jgi:hypothetical protein
MIADWPRLVRLGLVICIGLVAYARPWHGHVPVAWADDDDDDDDDDSAGDDDDDGGGDDDDDEGQPPVTAGGLYTKDTYPQAELERPLTITGGMTELRAGIDMDMSSGTAFETFGLGLDARYGVADNVEVQGDFRTRLNNFSGASNDRGKLTFKAAVEAGIVYDLVDFRLGMLVNNTDKTRVGFEVGFPFRYAPKPQVALIALDTFMTFDTDSKPDLTPSVGAIVQPVPMLALILHAQIIIKDFNTDAGNFLIPVSLNIQFSPSNKLDIGGEFTFPNLKPPEDPTTMMAPKFYDDRFLLLYGQIRI